MSGPYDGTTLRIQRDEISCFGRDEHQVAHTAGRVDIGQVNGRTIGDTR